MLALTQDAADAIGVLLETAPLPPGAGLRIARTSTDDGGAALALSLVEAPQEADTVLRREEARVFLSPEAEGMLSNLLLDARVDERGGVQFELRPQEGFSGP